MQKERIAHLLQQWHNLKKQSFSENKIECFEELLKFCNINFQVETFIIQSVEFFYVYFSKFINIYSFFALYVNKNHVFLVIFKRVFFCNIWFILFYSFIQNDSQFSNFLWLILPNLSCIFTLFSFYLINFVDPTLCSLVFNV